jgi:hypothetical protein
VETGGAREIDPNPVAVPVPLRVNVEDDKVGINVNVDNGEVDVAAEEIVKVDRADVGDGGEEDRGLGVDEEVDKVPTVMVERIGIELSVE